ncbi:MAG: hypothetical protein ACK6DP_12745 [Gemmatimonas sp.]|uniref:hypothetical protein n=1 Tax=Gemmatimonas sp. TaxID=1962908 RepID=UPI00391F3F60
MLTLSRLRDRFVEDSRPGGPGAAPALARALELIGWGSVREPSPAEMADHLLLLLDDCVHGHGDVAALAHAIAQALRDTGPLLDGGLPPVDAYVPAADELLQRYIADEGRPRRPPAFLPDLS